LNINTYLLTQWAPVVDVISTSLLLTLPGLQIYVLVQFCNKKMAMVSTSEVVNLRQEHFEDPL